MSVSFQGFIRSDGTAGTRNYVGVVSTVICSSTVVRSIAKQVPAAVPIVHTHGCAQLGDDLIQTKSTLAGVSANPNIGSVLLVGLGCETNQVDELVAMIPPDKPIRGIGIQALAGSNQTVSAGVEIAKKWAGEAAREKRQPIPLSSLSIGVIGIDSDEQSLCTAYPIIGRVVDRLLDYGTNIVVGLNKGIEPAGASLAQRAADPVSAGRLVKAAEGLYRRRWEKIDPGIADAQGWTAAELERAHREAVIVGSRPVAGVVSYGERPLQKGIHLMAVPDNPVEALSGLVAGGCSIVLIVSSRGLLAGSVAVPCFVVAHAGTSKPADDELVDCIVTGEDLDKEAEELIQNLLEVCSGRPTSLERLELGEFAISRVGTPF